MQLISLTTSDPIANKSSSRSGLKKEKLMQKKKERENTTIPDSKSMVFKLQEELQDVKKKIYERQKAASFKLKKEETFE
eukprot:8206575-Ditylum_brightwellii.AAC.1